MIHFYRSVSIAPGKLGSAMTLAKEFASYLRENHGSELTVAMPIGGNPNRIGWSTTYENLGAYEAAWAKIMADQNYLEMVRKGSENFIAGSVRDQLWRTL